MLMGERRYPQDIPSLEKYRADAKENFSIDPFFMVLCSTYLIGKPGVGLNMPFDPYLRYFQKINARNSNLVL